MIIFWHSSVWLNTESISHLLLFHPAGSPQSLFSAATSVFFQNVMIQTLLLKFHQQKGFITNQTVYELGGNSHV